MNYSVLSDYKFLKVEIILSGCSMWNWDDENSDELQEDEIFTKSALKSLINNFRNDTPDNIIEIFKQCVIFNLLDRIFIHEVSFKFDTYY